MMMTIIMMVGDDGRVMDDNSGDMMITIMFMLTDEAG